MLVTSTARLRYISIPPRKMRLVAGLIKGMPVEKALNVLNFTPKIAAHHLAKTLKSAAANALSKEGTDHLKPEELLIKNIIVDAAPMAKRIRFRSMGRVYRYHKRFCHLTVHLEGHSDEVAVKKAARPKKAKDESGEEKPVAKTKKTSPAKKKATVKKKTTAKKTKAAPVSKKKTETAAQDKKES